jgi:hypothetical protein
MNYLSHAQLVEITRNHPMPQEWYEDEQEECPFGGDDVEPEKPAYAFRGGASVEQADGRSKHAGGGHQFRKIQKRRRERRRAKRNPECFPGYGRYSGWEL